MIQINENQNKDIKDTNPNLQPLPDMQRRRTFAGVSNTSNILDEEKELKPLRSLSKRKKSVSFKADPVKIIDVEKWKQYNVDVSEADQAGNWKKGKLLRQIQEEQEMDRKEKEEKEAEAKKKEEKDKCACGSCVIF